MSTKDDSGSAFPSGDHPESQLYANPGMSLRDYFAASVMQGLCSNSDWLDAMASKLDGTGVRPDQAVAIASYEMADAMLEERAK